MLILLNMKTLSRLYLDYMEAIQEDIIRKGDY